MTQCNPAPLLFQNLGSRAVVASFDGGPISSDGGCLLLGEVERLTGTLRQLAACFTDHRDPEAIEHTVAQLVAQRVYGLALGYEDLNDHDHLRLDPLLATLVGKVDPTGADRLRQRDRGKALAGKSTLNRLELTPPDATAASRYQKIVARPEAIEQLFDSAVVIQDRGFGARDGSQGLGVVVQCLPVPGHRSAGIREAAPGAVGVASAVAMLRGGRLVVGSPKALRRLACAQTTS